ncbi:class I SAM-dependent methyltransferase [Pseudooceanicola onchidii]|uniref:class I SAM-dependent methyltransferase n=1 Tax=Pseudooceanicola onchidii TaxID=2562279 RepID=UPI00197D5D52|nr:class I SAM-dependent methyltransferase [Pseudooceanicola onchidii]
MPQDTRPDAPRVAFDKDMAKGYDARNSALAPISDNMHFLIQLALDDLPDTARVLCIGVGTGAEILSLARARPGWRFVGVDPSSAMLDVCRDRLEAEGLMDRCELIEGYVQDAPSDTFDVVLSVLVAHFIQRADRPAFYTAIRERVKPGGAYVTAEICQDFDSPDYPVLLENWKRVQARMGATPESLEKLPELLRTNLGVLSPHDTRALLGAAGFTRVTGFYQAVMIRGFIAQG